jgi:hypothetical protein
VHGRRDGRGGESTGKRKDQAFGISRPRPAPSESRSVISARRAAPRASRRFARFAHAIRSSTPTPTSNAVSDPDSSERLYDAPRDASVT